MGAYVYRGSIFDADKRADCGTRAGYQCHLARDEKACAPCSKANNVYTNARDKRRVKNKVGFTESKCGTPAGYAAHKYYKVAPCEPCLDANREYHHAYKARKAAA